MRYGVRKYGRVWIVTRKNNHTAFIQSTHRTWRDAWDTATERART